MISIVIVLFWLMGTLSVFAACVVAYIGDRNRAHQGMMEGIGMFIVAVLLQIAMRP
jgi:hypothetical protein